MKQRILVAALMVMALFAIHVISAEATVDRQALRQKAQKLYNDGNWKEAYDLYIKLCHDPQTADNQVSNDLSLATQCLNNLGRLDEWDAMIEATIDAHNDNWRLLRTAAQLYQNQQHYGFMIAGEYKRGHHRGGGKQMNSWERDRIRALQLMEQAMKQAEKDLQTAGDDKSLVNEVANFYLYFANNLMMHRGSRQAWRLQYKSDLSELPDYEEGGWYYYGGNRNQGAPVDAEGNVVLHHTPKSWDSAATDGERWRWLLMQAMEINKDLKGQVLYHFASFLHQQFGVQTMAYYGRNWMNAGQTSEDDGESDESGPYAVHTLKDNETIARTAIGIRRFTLPDEFNYIRIYKEIADAKSNYTSSATQTLAGIFENRRQYPTAVVWWKRFKEHNPSHAQDRIDQIVNNWGTFENSMTHPAGKGAELEYRFRNGGKVTFDAYRIDQEKLLADLKRYIESNPRQLDWNKLQINNVGWRIVHENEREYLQDKVAEWSLDLKPRKNHWDRRITVTTPLQKAGAYLLRAQMADGNMSRIVVWIDDTAIIRKPLKDKVYYYVADSVTGVPVANANVEFFGYRQEWVNGTRQYNIYVNKFAEHTDENGQIFIDPQKMHDAKNNGFNWLVIARTGESRLAHLGFSGVWTGHWYDAEYRANKVFCITDRPVYRPNQSVKWKIWLRHAQYDQEDVSQFANQNFTVRINNAKGDKIHEKTYQADEYGGIDGELALPDDAPLGVYQIYVVNYGGSNFRVEEYKKPEFEVTVDAPSEPVALGEEIEATVNAKYYFGAPVAKGKVKYKVQRFEHDSRWYPVMYWDWFYGPGYWWFAYDYSWYPGWREWGCRRPVWWWYGTRHTPPELVSEGEAEIGKDGTFKIKIDTGPAKAIHGDTDHKYTITAEVTDESRRVIVGTGNVLVARKPFKVYAWVDRGYYRVGNDISASFNAQTLDNKGVQGDGKLKLYRLTYDKNRKPIETEVQAWDLNTNDQGRAELQMKASRKGQYRLSYTVTDTKGHSIEGGYVFVVRGEGFDGKEYRFNHIELVTDKKDYAPGEKVKLMINADKAGTTVMLFIRPANGCYLPPEIIRLDGKSAVREIEVTKKDMPNFFVEALTLADGQVHQETREITVPPAKRVFNVEVLPSKEEYKPGEKATVKVKLTDLNGEPFVGSTVMAVYDKSVEYISGGTNVPEIKEFFWKWRRQHHPSVQHSLQRWFGVLLKKNEIGMQTLGVFGAMLADEAAGEDDEGWGDDKSDMDRRREKAEVSKRRGPAGRTSAMGFAAEAETLAPSVAMDSVTEATMEEKQAKDGLGRGPANEPTQPGGGAAAPVHVRTKFADTAFWQATLNTNPEGIAEVSFDMPENLTGWLVKVWGMAHGTKVGHGQTTVVTKKNLMLRLQAPRFFVQKDEVMLSANIHNYLKTDKEVTAILELDGPCLEPISDIRLGLEPVLLRDKDGIYRVRHKITIPAGGEERVDWRVKVAEEGEAVVRMKALTDEESDAMEMRFPSYVHGMMKQVPACGVIRPDRDSAKVTFTVPAERRINESRLEIRYSPTLAMAMIDALPYMLEYPYGCTEQTLNKFLPAVVTQKVLMDMGVDLKDIKDKVSNLNAQEIGDDKQRAEQWKKNRSTTPNRFGNDWVTFNPVYDRDRMQDIVKTGVKRLTNMQLSDGGWGWFSGYGEHSYPHTTAVVVRGLQTARNNDVAIIPGVIERGVQWLVNHQDKQVRRLQLYVDTNGNKGKRYADNLDAMIYMVLNDEKHDNVEMRNFLYRDRNESLAVYGKCMFGMALHTVKDFEKRDMVTRNIEQFLVQDDENHTAYLKLQNGNYWWYWYGSEYEAQAYYLKLLALTDPKSEKASRLVKYLLNNRKHATYWNSTRDTALVVEAFADYIRAAGEDKPDMTVEILLDGRKMKEVTINKENLFTFDNKLVLVGDAIETGEHTVEIRRKGTGPVYFNAYLDYFTLEDYITKAGMEIKVEREYYRLERVEKSIKAQGAHGQAVDQRVEKYERKPIQNLDTLKSGDLVEVELVMESKNDYEYIIFEDMKPAGFEPVEVRSGYNGNEMGAYVEFRDEKVCFFVRSLARGKHSLSYRMRAEIPGKFSALPTRGYAMYAPELKANSDEIKLKVED